MKLYRLGTEAIGILPFHLIEGENVKEVCWKILALPLFSFEVANSRPIALVFRSGFNYLEAGAGKDIL